VLPPSSSTALLSARTATSRPQPPALQQKSAAVSSIASTVAQPVLNVPGPQQSLAAPLVNTHLVAASPRIQLPAAVAAPLVQQPAAAPLQALQQLPAPMLPIQLVSVPAVHPAVAPVGPPPALPGATLQQAPAAVAASGQQQAAALQQPTHLYLPTAAGNVVQFATQQPQQPFTQQLHRVIPAAAFTQHPAAAMQFMQTKQVSIY